VSATALATEGVVRCRDCAVIAPLHAEECWARRWSAVDTGEGWDEWNERILHRVDDKAEVEAAVARGDAHTSQAHPKKGLIYYEFVGGAYDGVVMRCYPPFESVITQGGQRYVLGPPKNNRTKKLTFRLENPS
jgi:hypothetical protein